MKKFSLGIFVGLVIGLAVSATAAEILTTGYLLSYDVKVNHVKVCSGPYVWAGGINEIECSNSSIKIIEN